MEGNFGKSSLIDVILQVTLMSQKLSERQTRYGTGFEKGQGKKSRMHVWMTLIGDTADNETERE